VEHLEMIEQKYVWSELRQIIDVFNEMLRKVSRLMLDIKRQEQDKRKSDMEYLRAQINPHFIYNTLFSIKCMVSMGKNEQSEKMLSEFIAYLKSTLSYNSEYINVEEEIAGLKRYLAILKTRYGNDLSYVFSVEKDSKQCKIPVMVLQPLVENAVFHGIGPDNKKGVLKISSCTNQDRLIIEICDNGIGMTSNQIQNILNDNVQRTESNGKHIGVYNVNQRIKLYFGEEFGIELSSFPNCGTKVRVILPIL
jgi:two-component system sensor histidine kinase YesM